MEVSPSTVAFLFSFVIKGLALANPLMIVPKSKLGDIFGMMGNNGGFDVNRVDAT